MNAKFELNLCSQLIYFCKQENKKELLINLRLTGVNNYQ